MQSLCRARHVASACLSFRTRGNLPVLRQPNGGSRCPHITHAVQCCADGRKGPLHVIAEPPAVSPIYSKPALYEEAFSYRNIPAEVTFLLKAYADNTSQQEPQSVLELCCGPAAHSIELARRFQARVFAVDSAPPMVQHARMRAQQADVAVDINEGDVRNLHVTPCLESPVDLALCLLGSFSHMLTNADAVHALRSVGRHMRPGGLLVLELAHPGDLFDGSLIVRDGGAEGWEVARPGGGKLMVQWGSDYDNFNPATQILERTVTIDVVEDEDVVEAVEEVQASRQYTLQELDLLAQMTGYEVVQVNGDMTDGVDLDHEDAYRLVICLQKL